MKKHMRLTLVRCAVTVVMVIYVFVFTGNPTRAQGITGKVIAAASKDYDPKTGTGATLKSGSTMSIGNAGIALGSGEVRSWWVTIAGNIMTYSDFKATFTGSFRDATFSVYGDTEALKRYVYEARDGVGTIDNAKGEVIGEGPLRTAEKRLAIAGKKGATFRFEAHDASVRPTDFTDPELTDFALLTLTAANDWTINDDHFLFLAEVAELSRPTLFVVLPASITRSSIVTIPKGDVSLFGYSITAASDDAKVKFQKGIVVDCAGCTSTKQQK